MDATGTASMAAAAGFVWAVVRTAWREVEAHRARVWEARQKEWAGHDRCSALRSSGQCVGLSAGERPVPPPPPPPVTPDYVPEVLVGEVLAEMVREQGAS